jgi:hypothetical protein
MSDTAANDPNKGPAMIRGSMVILQILLVLIGVLVAGLLLWEPHLEGRNATATVFEIYFRDPFLAYAYVAAIPFFVGLYQAFKVAGYAGQNRLFSQDAVKAVRTIKYCAMAIIGFVIGGELYIVFGVRDEDGAGGIMIGLFIILCSIITAAVAAWIERGLRKRQLQTG